jgi:hypothetical protein
MAPTLPVRIAIRFANEAMISRVAARFSAKKKQSEEVPDDLVKAALAATGKMENAIKSKMGVKFEYQSDSNYDDGLYTMWFMGPTKKGVRSPHPQEVNGRFTLHYQVVRGGHSDDGSVDITANYIPWVKNRLEMSDTIDAQERGVAADKADEVAVKLMGEVAAKAKGMMKKK